VVIRSTRELREGDRVYCMPCLSRLVLVRSDSGHLEARVVYQVTSLGRGRRPPGVSGQAPGFGDSRRSGAPMRSEMTTKTPLIRRVGNGYSASWNGFYLYDEDLRRVLARVAELTRAQDDDERGRDERIALPRAAADRPSR
jgi:hypothetical protein